MPIIYLSPSTQEFNPYVDGGNEEYYMNLIADAMVPYLKATGIDYVRNSPNMTAASSIAASNKGSYDLHLALHSNAASPENSGRVQGSEVYYFPQSREGTRAAEIIANNLKLIYPIPEKVKTVPTTTLGEVTRTRAPSVLIEFAYHDNSQDAAWIRGNINNIAENVVVSLADFFGIPFNMPQPIYSTSVKTQGGNLNLRDGPGLAANVIVTIPNGSVVTVLSDFGDWRLVRYGEYTGYVYSSYLS